MVRTSYRIEYFLGIECPLGVDARLKDDTPRFL
jgi:hypothetical protein